MNADEDRRDDPPQRRKIRLGSFAQISDDSRAPAADLAAPSVGSASVRPASGQSDPSSGIDSSLSLNPAGDQVPPAPDAAPLLNPPLPPIPTSSPEDLRRRRRWQAQISRAATGNYAEQDEYGGFLVDE